MEHLGCYKEQRGHCGIPLHQIKLKTVFARPGLQPTSQLHYFYKLKDSLSA